MRNSKNTFGLVSFSIKKDQSFELRCIATCCSRTMTSAALKEKEKEDFSPKNEKMRRFQERKTKM